VGKIARLGISQVAVPGNFSHPASSEYLTAFSELGTGPPYSTSRRPSGALFSIILIPPAINNHQTNQADQPHAAESTGRDPN
jgi:hypothetical protein